MIDPDTAHEPTAPAAAHTRLPERERRLLFGLLLPPLSWSLHLIVSYGFVYPSIRLRSKALLVVTTIVCFAFALGGAALARTAGNAKPSEPKLGPPGSAPARPRELALPPNHDATRAERARFLSLAGVALGFFFAWVIAAQAVPIVLVGLEDG